MKFSFAILCVPLASANGFAIVGRQAQRWNCRATTTNTALFYAAPEMETMKLREIQAELKDLGVPFGDCFDRDSLLCRLRDAREGKIETKPSAAAAAAAASDEKASTDSAKPTVQLDADAILADLRSQPLKELKIQCSQRNLRYATFLEKEDFVQAIWKDMQAVASFSVSGALRPGKVSDITGEQLDREISSHETPILLDVYATWCKSVLLLCLYLLISAYGNTHRPSCFLSPSNPPPRRPLQNDGTGNGQGSRRTWFEMPCRKIGFR